MEIKLNHQKIRRQERRLENAKYKKYLYDKYKVIFIRPTLTFYFQGEQFHLGELMAKLHRLEQDGRMLDYYVTALFIAALSLGYWAITFLDAYLKTFK